jgi:hypothetical protein
MKRSLLLVPVIAALAGCFVGPAEEEPPPQLEAVRVVESPPLPAGTYQIQSISYDDATDAYDVFLLDPPPGTAPKFTTTQLRMARLDDEAIAAGKKSELRVDAEGPAAHLTPDFSIAYTHNVLEQRGNDVVVVRQESSAWSPFMSMMAGAAIGNMLFAPRYYYPPPYVGGGMLSGYGGVGTSRVDASRAYQATHGAPPQATRVATTGTTLKRAPTGSLRPSGVGAGSSRLGTPTRAPARRPSIGFGGGGRRRR